MESEEPQTWIAHFRHWMPPSLYPKAVAEYTKFMKGDVKEHVAKAIDEIERRYVEKWTGHEVELNWKGELKPIGRDEADKRNLLDPTYKALTALRIDLGIIPARPKNLYTMEIITNKEDKNGME